MQFLLNEFVLVLADIYFFSDNDWFIILTRFTFLLRSQQLVQKGELQSAEKMLLDFLLCRLLLQFTRNLSVTKEGNVLPKSQLDIYIYFANTLFFLRFLLSSSFYDHLGMELFYYYYHYYCIILSILCLLITNGFVFYQIQVKDLIILSTLFICEEIYPGSHCLYSNPKIATENHMVSWRC